ncbi:universal stress protein [Patulibacter sp. NPDC049589]|uniref:universal stress protein n=1 Tax=Patulibacter sp. NPDC049589 TaxID=3154731 RepID=UPI00342FEC1B
MSFRRVVAGVDGRPASLAALAVARQLAAPDAAITVAGVAVLPATLAVVGGVDDVSFARTVADQSLDGAREALADRAGTTFATPDAAGVSAGLHGLAIEDGADLLVVGASRHHGIGEVLLGNDAEATLHGAPCSVLVGPAGPAPAALRRIGVAFDGLPSGRRALRAAAALAAEHGAALEVLAVLDTRHPYATYGTTGGYGDPLPDARELLDAAVAEIRGVVAVDPLLRSGDPVREILDLGRDVDLLVLGSRRRGAVLRVLLGDVAGKVVRRADCAVLVVPDGDAVPGTESPRFG